jgi:hypothetical protein
MRRRVQAVLWPAGEILSGKKVFYLTVKEVLTMVVTSSKLKS